MAGLPKQLVEAGNQNYDCHVRWLLKTANGKWYQYDLDPGDKFRRTDLEEWCVTCANVGGYPLRIRVLNLDREDKVITDGPVFGIDPQRDANHPTVPQTGGADTTRAPGVTRQPHPAYMAMGVGVAVGAPIGPQDAHMPPGLPPDFWELDADEVRALLVYYWNHVWKYSPLERAANLLLNDLELTASLVRTGVTAYKEAMAEPLPSHEELLGSVQEAVGVALANVARAEKTAAAVAQIERHPHTRVTWVCDGADLPIRQANLQRIMVQAKLEVMFEDNHAIVDGRRNLLKRLAPLLEKIGWEIYRVEGIEPPGVTLPVMERANGQQRRNS